jgi:Tfp pilus assembly protein PilN
VLLNILSTEFSHTGNQLSEIDKVELRLEELETEKERFIMLLPNDRRMYTAKILDIESRIMANKAMLARLNGEEFNPFH